MVYFAEMASDKKSATKKAASTSVTVRMPVALKAEVKVVAEMTGRTFSNALVWLLRRGTAAYHETGWLEGGSERPHIKPIGSGIANEAKETPSRRRRA